ncbi:hypothetical protein JOF42_000498 [Microbacterium phyllosphaerae]|uniref:DUF3137 domain-containing protein n=1 Tax=Microbacterium phyllosphaerae TaxID=124798 RepID=A0ABS4WM29_9MICO|nr:hypothetical protein [Microbacterium phyllosphaerae]MBP2377003.1 hypothetical protein [Microbacterium phyllosphaerae]MCS3443096.1 hypothetical protein [Microbacterium phyllosphaerae]
MSAPQPAPPFDAGPLTDPVDPRAVSAFQTELRARGTSGVSAASIIAIVVFGLVFVVAMTLVGATMVSMFTDPGASSFAGLGILAAAGVGITIAIVSWRRSRVARYRLDAFARANGMSYEATAANPALPGMLFGLGRSREATDLVRGTQPRFVEFGNYQYTTGSGKNSTTHRWGYVAVKLDVPLPNIVLDAKGNNGFGSNLPASFQREQRLSLEGDFDQYFTLYCPEGYERDALYLFTPDIMARFIDNAAELDVEIVDDWLFLYTQRKASTLDPATWAWLFGAVGAVITKLDQWERWRDERLLIENPTAAAAASSRVSPQAAGERLPFAPPAGLLSPPPGVAHEGRRLKKSFPWLPFVVVIGFAVFWFWSRSF